MIRYFAFSALAMVFGTMSVFAQAKPYPSEARQTFGFISSDVLKAAEKMPEGDYGYRATPDVRPFGELVAHVADSRIFLCSAIKGEAKQGDAASKKTKNDLIAALRASFEYCDGVYGGINDATAAESIKLFGTETSKLRALYIVVGHENEMYGTMGVYLRLKGIVPPSTERTASRGR
jgi:uncharacterized damage-inducible protein DinB